MTNAYPLDPLILRPAYKDYLWGGNKIVSMFNRKVEHSPCAESWEASDRHEAQSVIQNGAYRGVLLNELIKKSPALFGVQVGSQFPLLIKLIDANEHLSIQVHPNEDKAHLFQGEPKSEMWYIIDAEPKSKVYLGLKKNVSKQVLKEAILSDSLDSYMNVVEVEKGQTYYIRAGMLHAIGKGSLIYEVQQNSNTTYRLYDWGRKDKEGKSRPLHIEQALSVMLEDQTYRQSPPKKILQKSESLDYIQLERCPFFTFNKLTLRSKFKLDVHDIFRVYFVLEGQVKISSATDDFSLNAGQSFLVPAHLSDLEFMSQSRFAILLETIPNKR